MAEVKDFNKWNKTYTLKEEAEFVNQRDDSVKNFKKGEIKLQIEGERDQYVSVRGKYPNDDWFATVRFDMLVEIETPKNLEQIFEEKYEEQSNLTTAIQYQKFYTVEEAKEDILTLAKNIITELVEQKKKELFEKKPFGYIQSNHEFNDFLDKLKLTRKK